MKDKIKIWIDKVPSWILYIVIIVNAIFIYIKRNSQDNTKIYFIPIFLLLFSMLVVCIKNLLSIKESFDDIDKNDPDLADIIRIILICVISFSFMAYLCGAFFLDISNLPLVGTQDGWLSLFGALGGGAMTLLGVWYTIRKQNELQESNNKRHEQERKEELATQYKPCLDLVKVIEEIPSGFGCNSIDFILLPDNHGLSFSTVFIGPECHLEFSNIGRGILCDLTFVSFKIINNNIFEHSYEFPQKYICSLAPNQKFYVDINLPSLLKLKQERKEIKNDRITIDLTLNATDEFNYNHFQIDIEAVVNLSMTTKTTYGKNEKFNDCIVYYDYKIESLKTIMIVLPKK